MSQGENCELDDPQTSDPLVPLRSAISTVEQIIAGLDDQGPSSEGLIEAALKRLASLTNHALAAVEGSQVWDQAVLLSEERFQDAPVPLLVTDPMGFVLRANERTLDLVGFSSGDVLQSHVGDYIHHDDYNSFADAWVRMQVETDFDSTVIEFRLLTALGPRWQRAALRASRDDELRLTNLTAHFADIDEKYAAEKALDRSERGFGNLLDSLPDPIVRLNRTFEVQFSNPAATSYRMPHAENDGWPLVAEADRSRYRIAAEECWASGSSTTIEHSMLVRGEMRWCESTFVPELGTGGTVKSLLVIWRDQTVRREHERILAHRASHDSLTELPNRGRFAELLEAAILRQATLLELGQIRPLAVLFLDLDRFKFVNDSLGHAAGDQLLCDVADRLCDAIRPGDVIGRLGGDEFTILAEDISSDDAVMMAERIQDQLRTPFDLNGREFIVSASVGVVSSDKPEEAADLMRWADSAMYRAKAMGRSCVATFDDVLRPEALEQLELDQMLRKSIDHGELEVHFQPEVHLVTERIVGVEALVRWNHPTLGEMGADRFIPLAEDNGMVLPIGRWVLRRACEQVMDWLARGVVDANFMLRVNLSARQFEDPRLIEDVSGLLAETGFDPRRLCLEITETALMRDVDEALVVLTGLHALGIELAVDDFGTGYSSLSMLKRFPIRVLKIDRSFVDGLPGDANDLAIVNTILSLATNLGLITTAEGVESQQQREALISMGCPTAQGYLFARPQAAAKIEGLLSGALVCDEFA